MAELAGFPVEIFDMICQDLSKDDLYHLRLSCRALAAKAKHQFYVRRFKVCQIMLTRESLESLIKFSKDQDIGQCIKEVQICLVTFISKFLSLIPGDPITIHEIEQANSILIDGCDEDLVTLTTETPEQAFKYYTRKLRRQRRRAYGAYASSQYTMRKQGADMKLIAEAMRNLSNLESVTIVDELDKENPPWGARKILYSTGMWPIMPPGPTRPGPIPRASHITMTYKKLVGSAYRAISIHALAVMFGAMAASGVRLKRSLSLLGPPRYFDLPETSLSRRLAPANTPAGTFSESRIQELEGVFADLKELSMRTEATRWLKPRPDSRSKPYTWISKYASVLNNLQSLSLEGQKAQLRGFGEILDLLALSDIFPRLQCLQLIVIDNRLEKLLEIISKRPLRKFSLRGCTLPNDCQGSETRLLLECLRKLPCLRSLALDGCAWHQFNPAAMLARQLPMVTPENEIFVDGKTPEAFQVALKVAEHRLNRDLREPPIF